MRGRWNTISVEVDIDDVLDSIETDVLEDELLRRHDRKIEESTIEDLPLYIESMTGRILLSMTNEELIHWVLGKLNRL